MRSRLIHKTRKTYREKMKEYHDQAVKRITEKPEILGIDGLSLETLLCKPFKFPELREKGQETGDLIFLWSPYLGKWEILVIEVQVGTFRSGKNAIFKLRKTRDYLINNWREWFTSIKLYLPEKYTISMRTVFVSYAGKAIWEQPWVEWKTKQIL